MAEAVADITSSLKSDRIWHVTAERLCALLDVDACDICVLDDDRLRCLASISGGRPQEAPAASGEHRLSDWPSFAGALRLRSAMAIEHVDNGGLTAGERAALQAAGMRAVLVVPVVAGDEAIGMVRVGETRRPRRFSREEMEAAQSLCHITGLAIRNARLYERQQTQTRRLETLLRATRAISSPLQLEQVLHTVTQQAVTSVGVSFAGIYEWDRQNDAMIARSSCMRDRILTGDLGTAFPLVEHESDRLVLEQALILNESVADPDLLPESRNGMQRAGEKRALTLPLVFKNEVLGQLVLADSNRDELFSAEEVEFARALADQAAIALHNAWIYQELEERAARMDSLLSVSRVLGSSLDLNEVLHTIAERARDALACRECVLFEYDEAAGTICERVSLVEANDYEPWIEPMPLDAYPGARAPLVTGELLVETIGDPALSPESRADMLEWGEKTCLTLPLLHGDRRLGFMVLIESEEERRFSDAELELARGLAEQAGIALHKARMYDDLRRLHVANLRTLSAAVGAKDPYTQGHAARVTAYMLLLGRELGWSVERMQRVEEAAMLHDVGKLVVSDRVLLKPGPLYDEEWQLMRQHPVISAEIVRPMLEDEYVRAIRHHHERYDGGGYPDGLAGGAIPLLARALSVADAYDAMSLRRPYRPAASYADCRRELEACSGTQFDPEMAAAFLRVLDRLHERKQQAHAAACEAAARIDPADHERLSRPDDHLHPAYGRLVAALQEVRERFPHVRFLTTLRRVGPDIVVVADAEGGTCERFRLGDTASVSDALERAWAGEELDSNAVHDDEFGVWVIGLAPVKDSEGRIVALVRAAIPADEAMDEFTSSGSLRAFTSVLSETLRRIGKAEIEAITDGLTGLYNHRHFHERLEEETQRARRHEKRLSLLFADIDRFKLFNDRLGHSAGDAALHGVARVIESCTRRTDIVARYGGEEFVAALVDTGPGEALEIAERIRERIAAGPLVPGGDGLTVSIGVAVFPDDAADKEELVEKADWAMYLAKRRGRDQVAAAGRARQRPRGAGKGDDAQREGTDPEPDGIFPGTNGADEVAALARRLARRLDLSSEEVRWAAAAARLRDVGYVGMPDGLPRGVRECAFAGDEVLPQHPQVGERLLRHLGYPPAVAEAVGQHHERLDGSGYPNGLRGTEIAAIARIVSVADTYHAMTTDRRRPRRRSVRQALAELKAGAGTLYDIDVLNALAGLLGERRG